jgi:hypothetical protein
LAQRVLLKAIRVAAFNFRESEDMVQSKLGVSEFSIPDLSLFRITPDASPKFVCKHRIFWVYRNSGIL